MDTAMNPGEQARFFIPKVGTPITAKVAHRGLYQITLAQELPFLSLDTGLTDAEGRSARIRHVSLELDGSVPRLMLDVEYPEPVDVEIDTGLLEPAKKRRDETRPYALQTRGEEEIVVDDSPLRPSPGMPWYRRLLVWFIAFI